MGRLFAFVLGLLMGLWFGRLMPDRQTEKSAGRPVRLTMPAFPSEPGGTSDPLTDIRGIGPAFEQALHASGIYTFADLARQNADDLAARMGGRVTAERILRDGWIEQARRKADEKADQ